jgi:hypothetical protein
VTYYGADLKTPVDPAIPIMRYQVGTAAPTTLTYAGANTPGIGVYCKNSTGVYEAWLDTTGKPGMWVCQGRALPGLGQAASRKASFRVDTSL